MGFRDRVRQAVADAARIRREDDKARAQAEKEAKKLAAARAKDNQKRRYAEAQAQILEAAGNNATGTIFSFGGPGCSVPLAREEARLLKDRLIKEGFSARTLEEYDRDTDMGRWTNVNVYIDFS